MRKVMLLSIVCATVLLSLVYVDFASAQATRTWVSGVGDDANPCSRTAPCKTFAGAISKTAPAGEINVLDPGGFGALTITKSITIRSDRFEAGVLVSGTPGITVVAGVNDRVVLEGLDFEGLGTGTNGVNFASGKELHIINCRIRNFTTTGVLVNSSTSGAEAFISDSFILFNGNSGNTQTGGVNVTGTNNVASILNTRIISNVNFAVQVNGTGTAIALVSSALLNTPVAMSTPNGTIICSGPSNAIGGSGSCTPSAFK